jgi:c(7)-type cytochrome triheme protein
MTTGLRRLLPGPFCKEKRRMWSMKKAGSLLPAIGLVVCWSAAFGAVGGGDMTFKGKDAKSVFFSHARHVEGENKKCSACHYSVFQMQKDSYKMDMSKINKGMFCGSCHNGKRSFDVKDKANCEKCHK